MFTTPTVFVLGAGASWHYGYPTGEDLVRCVITIAHDLHRFSEFSQSDNVLLPGFLIARAADPQTITKQDANLLWKGLSDEALQLARRLEQVNPTLIDYFLAQNPDLHEIGRLAIAMAIFNCEAKYVALNGNPNHQRVYDRLVHQGKAPRNIAVTSTMFDDDWLRFVIYKITSKCKTPSNLHSNRITFVTFNYDSSLEQRLFDGIRNISFFNGEDIQGFITQRVLHVYGKVRERIDHTWGQINVGLPTHLDSQSCDAAMRMLNIVHTASLGIRTIDGDDKEKNVEELETARRAIRESSQIYVLGFGFDQANCERIGLQSLFDVPGARHTVMLTNFGGHNRVARSAARVLLKEPEMLSQDRFAGGIHRIVEDRPTYVNWQVSTKNVYDALAQDFDTLEN